MYNNNNTGATTTTTNNSNINWYKTLTKRSAPRRVLREYYLGEGDRVRLVNLWVPFGHF